MMEFPAKATLLDIAEGMRSQPGRIILSFVSILIGIVSLTVLIAVLSGLKAKSDSLVEELGINTFAITISPSETDDGQSRPLTQRVYVILRENLPGCLFAGIKKYDVPTPDSERTVQLIAADPALLEARNWKVAEGRFLDTDDALELRRNAVLTLSLSRKKDWRIGETILLGGTPFNVIGTLRAGSESLESESGASSLAVRPEAVFVPRSLPPYWLPSDASAEMIDTIFVRIPPGADIDTYVRRSSRILDAPEFKGLEPSWVTPETLLERIQQLQRTIRLTLGSVAALCLVLGCTALTSLMILNVRDRIREIGLRRALGATRKDVALLFVLEGGIVTAMAGIVGVGLTTLILWLARARFPVAPHFGLTSLLLPILTAIALGALASLWPAVEAAKIAPSEALRND